MSKSFKHIGAVVTACLTVIAGVAIAQTTNNAGSPGPGTGSTLDQGRTTGTMGTTQNPQPYSSTNTPGTTNNQGTSNAGRTTDSSGMSGSNSDRLDNSDRMNSDGSMRSPRSDRN